MGAIGQSSRRQTEFEDRLARGLPEFLPGRRWFGGKARRIASAQAEDCAWLAEGERPCALVITRVDYTSGPPDRYAMLLALVPAGGPDRSVGILSATHGSRHIVEASSHPLDALALLRHFDHAHDLEGLHGGTLRFGDLAPDDAGTQAWAGPKVALRPMGAEQSNTSLRVGEGHVFKLVRRFEPGENPEVEMGRFLATRTRFRACPTLRASITWIPRGGMPGTLGMLQDRIENEGDGWTWTLARLEEGAAPVTLLEAFRELGQVTAELHLALASRRDVPDFAPEPVRQADVAGWTGEFIARSERLAALLEAGSPLGSPETRRDCEALLRAWPRLAAAADLPAIAGRAGFEKIRVHGDYHLGQTLRTGAGFVVIDFEGEPARPLAERRRLHCALKDVAGMARSFDYALEVSRARTPANRSGGTDSPRLREVFLEGYLGRATGPGAGFLPEEGAARARWLRFFELDKALYEAEYEIQNRPDWLGIPVRGMLRLLGEIAAPDGRRVAAARNSKGRAMAEPRRSSGRGRATPSARAARSSAASPAAESRGEVESREEALRVVIENVRPNVDQGRYAVKRTVGESLEVRADVFTDGHDRLTVRLRHRPAGTREWSEAPMAPLGSDVWSASFALDRPGFHEYTVEAWIDRFGTWRDELTKKSTAGQDVGSELIEGAGLVQGAAARTSGGAARWLETRAGELAADLPLASRVPLALDEALADAMDRTPDTQGRVEAPQLLRVWADRERARFGSWYEMFPRSAGPDPARSATFREAESRLPAIAAMGFDVLYLPPVHPIGRAHRKGRNNTLEAKPGDPGSPWAIGAAEGGHTAIEPGLGTLADFDHFVSAARDQGIEVALDLAFQCSPDHPWVREHPEWFRHRPDGSIKYAENPPKKYQDIYPLHFECADWRELWNALIEVVRFWIAHDVRIFRVDNPHTKPFRFWDWMIGEIQRDHPDVLFLSEAFTRPRVMQRLAKGGFTQSYTYFTWRNRKRELVEYFTELTTPPVCEYLRPNLFANTPDILHEVLQTGGRTAFQIRHLLAATLGASYGIYGPPYELCEGRAIAGSEEYEHSEKYEVRAWDHDRPGHLRDWIGLLNRARHEHPALQFDHRLRFHPVDGEELIFYSKTTADLADVVLVVVNLDPHHVHHGFVEVPIEDLGIPPDQTYQVHDLLSDDRFLWSGSRNYVRLDPQVLPGHLLVLRRKVGTERDFDYYL